MTDSALANLTDGLILIDSAHRIAFANPRAGTMLDARGLGIGAAAEQFIEQIVTQSSNAKAARVQISDALAAESETAVELELTNPPRHISARFFPLRAPRGNLGTGVLLRDVTRERQADAMKSQLLSTVSHELRTPLASIKGFATTLLRQDVKWDEATQRDFLRIIEEETDRLTEIIDNLLDMSQIEAGVLRIAKEPTQLRSIIREVVDEMRMRTEAHWFVVDLPADLPRIIADPRRIRQVLHNLIENAIKYTEGGQITVACEIEPAQVVVSVSDQGAGIASEYSDKIFERFFQMDGKSTRRVGGAGLGLSISRGIIEAHGGRIWVESIVGQGSIFRFALPIAPNETS
ncbi:MAG: PAS domain-containing protein [Chloroflexi bacterium]|nr:PAS domain-containing protein [Chloroflexota bacterium]